MLMSLCRRQCSGYIGALAGRGWNGLGGGVGMKGLQEGLNINFTVQRRSIGLTRTGVGGMIGSICVVGGRVCGSRIGGFN